MKESGELCDRRRAENDVRCGEQRIIREKESGE